MWPFNRPGAVAPRPVTVYWHVTRRCNLHCAYCYLDAAPSAADGLTSRDLRGILRRIVAFRPERLVITGGEPLLRPDLPDLASQCRRLAPETQLCLATNATLVDGALASRLVALFDEIRISLDGSGPTNDALRGPGTYQATLAGIRAVCAAGGTPSLAITLTGANAPELPMLVHYMAVEWGIRTFRVNPLKLLGRATANGLAPPEESAVQILSGEGLALSRCPADGSCLGHTLSITPEGQVFPCHWFTGDAYCLGDALHEGLDRALGRLGGLGACGGSPPMAD